MPQSSARRTPQPWLDPENSPLIESQLIECLRHYPHMTDDLYEAAVYSIGSPGHRWRPILLIRVYEKLDKKADRSKIVPLACAIEFMHGASLIIDDLPSSDDATLRRGKQPCHLRFGEARAILTAFWLCDVAQHLIHEFEGSWPGVDLEGLFRQTKNEMMKGQVLDLQQKSLVEDQIIEKYRLKSGALYAFTASAPAHCLRFNELATHLSAFGNYLGIAYQCSDDIFDQTGSVEVLGKDVGKDKSKRTLPALLGIRKTTEIRDYYKLKAINELSNIPAPIDDLIQLVEQICL